MHERWLAGAAGKDAQVLPKHLYGCSGRGLPTAGCGYFRPYVLATSALKAWYSSG
jgi:hypothetical protein